MKTDLEAINDRIENLKCEPTNESMLEIANILSAIVRELHRIDHRLSRTANIASCLANGIEPD